MKNDNTDNKTKIRYLHFLSENNCLVINELENKEVILLLK